MSIALVFFVLPIAFAHADCPAGSSPASAGDLADMKAAGIQNPTVGMCWNKTDASTGAATAQAKQDLQQYVCNSGVNVQGLDSKFSTCADKFLKQLRSVDSSACITSAYRSVQSQAAACVSVCGNSSGCPGRCAPPGKSYHQKGLALDMRSKVSNQQLWDIAGQSGLYNPTGLHSSDPRHVQSKSGSTCSAGDVPAGDNGDYFGDTNHYFQSNALPFDNSLRQSLGMTPAPAATAAPIASAAPATTATTPTTSATPATTGTSATAPSLGTLNSTPYTAGTCAPQTYCSSQDGNIYYRTTTCVDQQYQHCPNGCAGVVCNATSTNAANTQWGDTGTTITNNNTNNNSNTNATSSFDLINYIANPPTAVEIGTSTPVDISNAVQDTGNASVLQPAYASSGAPIQTPSQASIYGPVPSQTFTSTDLANAPATGFFGNGSQGLYERIKTTLANILSYLQPFGSLNRPQNLI